jgi:hypothetical protein
MAWKMLAGFLLGFTSCVFLFFCFGSNLEVPFSVSGFVVRDLGFGGEVSAPSDYVAEGDIFVFEDEIVLKISGASISSYLDSGSMVPVLDKGANGIRIVPTSEAQIEVGDIVSFRMGGILVVHRVIEKGLDEGGVYFVVKGDSNLVGEGKIRFEDIEYLTVGIIY